MGERKCRRGVEQGILYLLCRRLFVYIPRTGNGDGPFDMSPLAKMLRDKRGKTLGRPPLVSRLLAAKELRPPHLGRNGFSRPLKTP